MWGELRDGKRPASKPRKRFKDCLKASLKKTCITTQMCINTDMDRDVWDSNIVQAVNGFEE